MRITIKAAIIGAIITGVFVILATIIGLLKSSSPSTTIKTGNQHEGSPIFAGDANNVEVTTVKTGDQLGNSYIFAGDVNGIIIHHNIPPDETRDAIKELEDRIEDVNTDVALTRKDLKILTRALKDLEQRTSGIEKLPDGRIRIGSIITGHATVAMDENNAAAKYYKEKDFVKAFEHSKRAIQAYEESQRKVAEMKPTMEADLNKRAVAIIYYLGALSANRLKKDEQAYEWAEKANNHESNPKRIAILAITLFNLNRRTDALQVIENGLKQYPNDSSLLKIRNDLTKDNKAQENKVINL